MKIEYRNPTIRTVCTDTTVARRTYGLPMALKISQRCTQIEQAECIGELLDKREGRCHRLKGNRKEQFAMDLVHPMRLIFSVTPTLHLCLEAIESASEDVLQTAVIEEITDYHHHDKKH